MLKTSSTKSAELRKGGVGVDGNSRAGRDRMDNLEIDGGKIKDDEVGKKGRKTFKSKNLSKSKKMVGLDFLTPGARLTFTKLRQMFVKTPILHHFDLKRHFRIETDVSGYAIGEVLS